MRRPVGGSRDGGFRAWFVRSGVDA